MLEANELRIDIAEEFSRYPAGRGDTDGEFNGRRFRRDFLTPRLREAIMSGTKLCVNLEGVRSFGSSFLEEAFGGLVRDDAFTKRDILDHLNLTSEWAGYERYKRAIRKYIEAAGR